MFCAVFIDDVHQKLILVKQCIDYMSQFILFPIERRAKIKRSTYPDSKNYSLYRRPLQEVTQMPYLFRATTMMPPLYLSSQSNLRRRFFLHVHAWAVWSWTCQFSF